MKNLEDYLWKNLFYFDWTESLITDYFASMIKGFFEEFGDRGKGKCVRLLLTTFRSEIYFFKNCQRNGKIFVSMKRLDEMVEDEKFIPFRSKFRWSRFEFFRKFNWTQSYYFHVLRYETSNGGVPVIIISKLQVHELCIGRNLQEDDLSQR